MKAFPLDDAARILHHSSGGPPPPLRGDGYAPVLAPLATCVAACLAAQIRLLAHQYAVARNFHPAALIPWLDWAGVGTSSRAERQSVIEIERDGRLGIDLKFGSITFKEEEKGRFAVALVDVLVGAAGEVGTRVQMEVKVPADPETESILAVTEACRTHIVAILRAAADTLDRTSARALVFHGAEAA